MLEGFFSILLGRWRGLVREKRYVLLFKREMDNEKDYPHADR